MTDDDLHAALLAMTNAHGVMTPLGISRVSEAHRHAAALALVERGRSFPELLRPPELSVQKLTARGYKKRKGLLYEVWWIPPAEPEKKKPRRKKAAKAQSG